MKKIILPIAVIIFLLGTATPQSNALDLSFNVVFTADNIVDSWLLTPEDSILYDSLSDDNLSNWRIPSTWELDIGGYDRYSLIWKIQNSGDAAGNNPGGFLAEFIDNPLGGDVDPLQFDNGSLLSSMTWLVSLDQSQWVSATEWGANNDPDTIWYKNMRIDDGTGNLVLDPGPVADISDEAQWIWWAENGAQSPETVYVRVDIGNPVPEPGTFFLLGMGLAGMLTIRKKFTR